MTEFINSLSFLGSILGIDGTSLLEAALMASTLFSSSLLGIARGYG
jgi:hypothetical protein